MRTHKTLVHKSTQIFVLRKKIQTQVLPKTGGTNGIVNAWAC